MDIPSESQVHESDQLPPSLDHNHLKTLDLHQAEPTWDKGGKEGRNAYGGVIFNNKGQVLMVEPTNHFMGYVWTFPKGKLDPGEHPADVGVREVKEESGHDASIIGLVPRRFPSPTNPLKSGHSQYFIMRSHGQTSEPDWETSQVRWGIPTKAHQMIDQTHDANGRARDHEILDMAVKHLKLLKSNPEVNSHLRPSAQRKMYAKSTGDSCSGHCGCNKCAAEEAVDRIMYERAERAYLNRVKRVLYECRVKYSRDDESDSGHYGKWIPGWREKVTPHEFITARNNTKYQNFLSPLEESDIDHHRLILSQDGSVGSCCIFRR